MYSEKTTAKHCERIEAKLGLTLHRYTPDQSAELTAYLTRLKADGKLYDANGQFNSRDHAAFVRNERILFQQDFFYALRYFQIERDGVEGGGVGRFGDTFWESQQILLDLIAKLEEKNVDYYERGYPCDGILICDNKGGRQLGHTMVARALTVHRLIGWPNTRAMGASVDEDKVMELYNRDIMMINGLPFFLMPDKWGTPEGGYDKKGEHIQLEALGSRVLYQNSKQKSGIGTGRQFDMNHNTELSQWDYPHLLELDFFPTLPQNPYTFSLQETTPRGNDGWWYSFSERVRKGKMPRWAYLYIPFYAEPKKYRSHPPDGWTPSEATMQMAWKVNQTSAEFVGKQITLTREQLHWWELNYNSALENNALNLFLSNYSITPQQSFQSSTLSAINPLTLDWMRSSTTEGIVFELEGL